MFCESINLLERNLHCDARLEIFPEIDKIQTCFRQNQNAVCCASHTHLFCEKVVPRDINIKIFSKMTLKVGILPIK